MADMAEQMCEQEYETEIRTFLDYEIKVSTRTTLPLNEDPTWLLYGTHGIHEDITVTPRGRVFLSLKVFGREEPKPTSKPCWLVLSEDNLVKAKEAKVWDYYFDLGMDVDYGDDHFHTGRASIHPGYMVLRSSWSRNLRGDWVWGEDVITLEVDEEGIIMMSGLSEFSAKARDNNPNEEIGSFETRWKGARSIGQAFPFRAEQEDGRLLAHGQTLEFDLFWHEDDDLDINFRVRLSQDWMTDINISLRPYDLVLDVWCNAHKGHVLQGQVHFEQDKRVARMTSPWRRERTLETHDTQVWEDHYEEVGLRVTPAFTSSSLMFEDGPAGAQSTLVLDVISYVPETNLVHAFQMVEAVEAIEDQEATSGTILLGGDTTDIFGGLIFNPTILYRLQDGSLWEEVPPIQGEEHTWHTPHGCMDCSRYGGNDWHCLRCQWPESQPDPSEWLPKDKDEEREDIPPSPLGNGLAPAGYQSRTIKRLCANDLRSP
jgi:hypothetical protein